ncbi:MAG: SDR family NAD(P)-dependent oxidoreductase [Deltaproteobacteria bacterium]|nr:SDR family NAD(P)-dependent oxidoreductase [Deltaproteobacteria bacterium]
MLTEFRDRVAVVTGAASGIGRALCDRFAREGMKLVMADVERDRLAQAASELTDQGVDVLAVRTDVSRADDLSHLRDETLERYGAVHVLCNNAGVFAGGLSWDAISTDWEWVLGVNLYGILHGVRAFVPVMLEQNQPGHIVNTCSMAGLINMPLSGAYSVSKHAALSLTETLYHELRIKQSPVGVSALCPELIRTRIGHSERNRPAHLKRPEGSATPEQTLVEQAIQSSTAGGLDPSAMAERVFQGIREDRFYLLADEGTSWDRACLARLEDIRLRRNPTLGVVTSGN